MGMVLLRPMVKELHLKFLKHFKNLIKQICYRIIPLKTWKLFCLPQKLILFFSEMYDEFQHYPFITTPLPLKVTQPFSTFNQPTVILLHSAGLPPMNTQIFIATTMYPFHQRKHLTWSTFCYCDSIKLPFLMNRQPEDCRQPATFIHTRPHLNSFLKTPRTVKIEVGVSI